MKRTFRQTGILMFLLLALSASLSVAQNTVVSGRITDAATGEVIPFANIIFKNSTTGTISDTTGFYRLSSPKGFDSLQFNVLGYETAVVPVKSNQSQQVDVKLTSNMYDLSEVVVNPGENPAWEVLRRTITAKEQNSPENKKSYQYDEYSKIEFDLNHFSEKIRNNILLRPFDFIWDHVDSTEEGVAYLPVLLIENNSSHYYEQEGNKRREIVRAHRSSGLEGPKIMQFVQDMYILPNFYDDYVDILDKQFPSPLNDNYKTNYRFYLTDSLKEKGEVYYRIVFKPRTFNALAFSGQMLIHKGSYALKEITVRFDITANINFVRSYFMSQEFEPTKKGHWMMTKSRLLGDFTVLENQSEMTGFFGRKTTEIGNMSVNEDIPDELFRGVDLKIYTDSARIRDDAYWENSRPIPLTDQEHQIYSMVEKIEDHPAFILRKNVLTAIWSGYYPKKYIDLGDIYTFYSYNQVEYSRFKLGFRTREELFKNTLFSAFGAYGDRDERFKYGGSLEHEFPGERSRALRIGGRYKYDIEQLGWSYNYIPIDHLFASLIQLNLSATRTYNEHLEGYVERQWFTGFSTRLSVFQHHVTPNDQMNFLVRDSGIVSTVDGFRKAGATFSLRFAPGKRETKADYNDPSHRYDFRGLPVISIQYSTGQKDVLNSDFDFHDIRIRLDHRLHFRKWGYLNYLAEAGKITGSMPYHFLHVPYANEVLFYDKIAFNLMNYLEFVNDEFVQLQLEHHFEGLLMNLMPLTRKAKLRTLVFGKAMAGSISRENFNNKYLFAAGSYRMTEPYYEVGFGIENILKISRIDFVWRLNYLDHPSIYPFIIKPSFQFKF